MSNLLRRYAPVLWTIPAIAIAAVAAAHGFSLHAVGDGGWTPTVFTALG